MKYLKLFEDFSDKIYEYYNNIPKSLPRSSSGNLSDKRSMGSVNWFTREEIKEIRSAAKSIGIPYIFESSDKGFDNFFGDKSGRGIKQSIYEFFNEGGDLCGEVNLSTKYGNYTIIKKEGRFVLNGKEVGKSVYDALSILR